MYIYIQILLAYYLNDCLLATAKPFGLVYRTNGDETTTPSVDGTTGLTVNGNLGFCFTFQQYST
jgi:hypothetical protein